jgi:pSer/pThr/pTyr-binding forkhead associated (FHA) protein
LSANGTSEKDGEARSMTAEAPFDPDAVSPDEVREQLDAERGGVSFLVYRDGHGTQQIYALEDTATRKIRIGRALSADVVITWDPKVSGIHAEFERVGDDWAIVDDGLSSNGTFANGRRIRGRRRLENEDRLRFGDTVVIYRAPRTEEYSKTVVSDPG